MDKSSPSLAFQQLPSLSHKIKSRLQRLRDVTARQENELISKVGLCRLLAEDLKRHMYDWTLPGFRALAVYRFGVWCRTLPFLPLRLLLMWVHAILFRLVRNNYGIELYATSKLGRRLLIGHQSGIVIHRFATFGDDCLIRQNVTLGEAGLGRDNFAAGVGPVVGNDVDIGAGAVIIGNVHIGDHVRISPNAVVMTNVPANATVMAPPPRVMLRPTEEMPCEHGQVCKGMRQ